MTASTARLLPVDGAPALTIEWASATDIGRIRSLNEDSLLADPPIFMVADGMGGHDAGEVASAIAADEFGRLAGVEDLRIDDLVTSLARAADRIDEIGTGSALSAGTTVALVAPMLIEGQPYWTVMNLGDSRVYRLSDGELEQVSIDHSVVQELIDRGDLTPLEARTHPYRHMITRALGAGPASEPDFWLIPIEAGDRMLICSDGLTGELEDDEIRAELAAGTSSSAVSRSLVERAVRAGGHDNVSVVVIDALAVGESDIRGIETTTLPRSAEARLGRDDEDTQPRRHGPFRAPHAGDSR